MKDFKQVHKLLLNNLKDLDEELSEITNEKYPSTYSNKNINKPDSESSKNTYALKEVTMNDLKKINHAIIQIGGESNGDF